jgi:hypothetical protein
MLFVDNDHEFATIFVRFVNEVIERQTPLVISTELAAVFRFTLNLLPIDKVDIFFGAVPGSDH